MKWFDPKEILPPENIYVLIYVPGQPWITEDMKGVFYDIACLQKGISLKERDALPKDSYRKTLYTGADEHGNNLVPYCWDTFGPQKYFGQEVKKWSLIDYAE